MPDLLRNLGINIPTLESRPINQEYEDYAQKEDEERSNLSHGIEDLFINAPVGIFKGLLGIEPDAERKDFSDYANLGTQLLTSGLPFAAYDLPKVFHGSQRLFKKFNPALYDKADTLGWATHFAENPEYAGSYAMGKIKGIMPVDQIGGALKEADLNPYKYYGSGFPNKIISPHVIPATIDAKNVLDLVDPNIDDLSQALASLNPESRRNLIDEFKAIKEDLGKAKEDPNPNVLDRFFTHYLDSRHYPESPPIDEIPVRYLADKLRLSQEEFNKTPFDAIRYRDVGEKSWAVPEGTPIKSIFGHEFTEPEKYLKVIPSHDPNVGTQNVLNEISQSYNVPITSHQETSKVNELMDQLKKSLGNIPGGSEKVLFNKPVQQNSFLKQQFDIDHAHLMDQFNNGILSGNEVHDEVDKLIKYYQEAGYNPHHY